MKQGFTKQELLIAIPVVVVVCIGIAWGMWYEFARVQDARRYSEALQWHSALQWYFRMHAVYPSLPQDGSLLTGMCLVDKGFAGEQDSSCASPARIYHIGAESEVRYYPRNADGTVCTVPTGCARYYLSVPQKTRAISGQARDIFRQKPRGLHIMGPEGMLLDQKTIPGL